MTFEEALEAIKTGMRVSRAGWNGRGMFVALELPTAGSRMTLPFLYLRTVQGDRVPWLASQTDLLAADWLVTHDAEAPPSARVCGNCRHRLGEHAAAFPHGCANKDPNGAPVACECTAFVDRALPLPSGNFPAGPETMTVALEALANALAKVEAAAREAVAAYDDPDFPSLRRDSSMIRLRRALVELDDLRNVNLARAHR